jgi:thiol-disulfide isomerase/thioredoxin
VPFVSDLPSRLSRWEPSRLVKTAFVAFAAACLAALVFAKWYGATVAARQKVEAALQVRRLSGPAPALALKERGGREVSVAGLRGKVVFVNFWATWCGPCREEMPSLEALARAFDPDDVAFLAVSVDEAWPEVEAFFGAGARPPFTLLLDPDQAVSRSWGTEKYPESFVVGRDGELLYRIVGARDWDVPAARRLLEAVGARRRPGRTP